LKNRDLNAADGKLSLNWKSADLLYWKKGKHIFPSNSFSNLEINQHRASLPWASVCVCG